MQKHKLIAQIKRYAKKDRADLDRLNKIQWEFERAEEDRIKAKNLHYTEECRMIDRARDEIQGVFDHFFGFANCYGTIAGWDWINGNDNYKKLKTGG